MKIAGRFPTPMRVLITEYQSYRGMTQKVEVEGDVFFGAVKGYGGTDTETNGVVGVEDTAIVETWFRPDIATADRLQLLDDLSIWEIMNVEDMDRRHQHVRLKIKRVGGGA